MENVVVIPVQVKEDCRHMHHGILTQHLHVKHVDGAVMLDMWNLHDLV